ncbi:MAG: hypothetical protein LBR13_06485 [Dysgonamonadaceae bacterium]|jgi:hypothetical protein|nr:hypothetical protein [Dysgonamonadaceae bacterium]
MKKRIIYLFITVCVADSTFSQQIDLNDTKSKFSKSDLLKLTGGFSASSVFYRGNEAYTRDPLTYYLTGNINFNILGLINLPFTFNFTNSGANYTYPTMPNRLSIHPAYKFLTGHFGDISMSFSPYTLNGHQFTGAGLDVNLDKPLKFSVMYGRLQRGVEFGSGNNQVQAAYKRMGAGFNVRYEKTKYRIALSLFSAKDDKNSLMWKPDSLMIYPQQNIAGSITVGFNLLENMQLTIEYGLSRFDRDVRIAGIENKTAEYHALKTGLNYTFMNNTIGIGYERIDPDYKTLGAYYFNNDLENITLNYARPFFGNKANIAMSGGIQHDDLKNEKESKTNRFVFSADANYAPTDKLSFSGSYTTFQTHINMRSQFDYINELTPYDNLDTLNYTQLSQNVNLSTNYMFGNSDAAKHLLNLMLSYQEAADKQGDIIPEGFATLFYNASLAYGLQLAPQNLNFNLSMNFTSNKMEGQNMYIIGPTAGITSLLFDKKLNTVLSVSYNRSYLAGTMQNEVWNLRFGSSYILMKKHNLSLSAVYRNNSVLKDAAVARTNGLTITTAYNYRF